MRFLRVCWIFSKHLVFYKLTVHKKDNLGKRLKIAFQELGITFIKIGQILSMRYDILPKADCEELQQLLDNVNPIPIEDIHRLLQEEYGKPHNLVFRNFVAQPLGSASVSQVHKAETPDGLAVAVKIKRPEVDKEFFKDIKIMKILAWLAEFFSPTLRRVQARGLVNYFESWISQDLDFENEVRNMRKLYGQYSFSQKSFRSDLGRVVLALPLEELCTKNIVVMDYLEGMPMSRKISILASPSYDAEKSIKTYVNAATRNWFRDNRENYLFQADPHLSNILALPNGDAASIDSGLICELSKREAQQAKELFIAVYMRDIKRVLKIATDITGVSFTKYAPIIRPDIEVYLEKTRTEGFGFWFMEFAKIMLKHKIKFPLYLTELGRANLILDGLVKTYMPHKTTLDLLGRELRQAALEEAFTNFAGANWLKVGYTLGQKIQEGPEIISEFIENPLNIISEIARAVKV